MVKGADASTTTGRRILAVRSARLHMTRLQQQDDVVGLHAPVNMYGGGVDDGDGGDGGVRRVGVANVHAVHPNVYTWCQGCGVQFVPGIHNVHVVGTTDIIMCSKCYAASSSPTVVNFRRTSEQKEAPSE